MTLQFRLQTSDILSALATSHFCHPNHMEMQHIKGIPRTEQLTLPYKYLT